MLTPVHFEVFGVCSSQFFHRVVQYYRHSGYTIGIGESMKYALSKMIVNEVVMSWNSQAEVTVIIILTKKNTSTWL